MSKARNPHHFRRTPLLLVKASHTTACLSFFNRSSMQRLSLGSAARIGDTDLAWLGRKFWWVSLVPKPSLGAADRTRRILNGESSPEAEYSELTLKYNDDSEA